MPEHGVESGVPEHGVQGGAPEHGVQDGAPEHGVQGGVASEPGALTNPIQLTDPQMMRALAHQARIAIWLHLGLHGPATATECAEVAGLSPSACSYHLRTLARYGFVEEDPDSAADG